jgi:archaellum component FlaC
MFNVKNIKIIYIIVKNMYHRKKQTTTNDRKQMSKTATSNNYGIFKHQDSRYMKWLKQKLDERETKDSDKLIYFRNDIIEAKKRVVNYRNQIERMENEIQRDNLNHNSLEHLQQQINQFRILTFTYIIPINIR